MNELTKQDLDKLIDSIDSWEREDTYTLHSHEAIRSMYTDPEQLAEFDKITNNKRKELMKQIKIKKDQSIILKYKLVKMKESIDAGLALNKFKEK